MADDWIQNELLEAFHSVVEDYRTGYIDDETFKERLFRIAERYERSAGLQKAGDSQKELF